MTLDAQDNIVPIIDISGLAGQEADRTRIAASIGKACRETGFFYVSNHSIAQNLIDRVLAEARAFFALPLGVKSRALAADSPCRHGYEPMREQTLEAGAPPDLKEGFNMGPDVAQDDQLVQVDPANHGPNPWPSDQPAFRGVMLEYLNAIIGLSERILHGLALSLDLSEDYFNEFSATPVATLRVLHYPPQPGNPSPGEKGCGAHTDWGALTVLLQDSAGGLEVRHRELGWVKAPPISGTFVVNIGDLMARWTNDIYKSTQHRVINYSGKDRYSAPFFYIGKSDYLISCIPQCQRTVEEARFPPITVMGHMEEMVRRTFAQ